MVLSDISKTPLSPHELELSSPDSSTKVESRPPDSSLRSQFKSLTLLFEPKLAPTTLLYMLIWFTLCFGSYGLSTWISVLFDAIGMGNVYLSSFIFTLGNLPGNIVSILFIEQAGRKNMLAYGMIFAAISALGFGFGSAYPALVILSASLFNAFSVVGWNALDCISVENFPTEIRTSAMGLLAAAGRMGAISAQFVNGSLENNIAILLFVTSGCMFVGGFASLYTPPDTTGRSLGGHSL
jgi:MFS family permease